MASNIRTAHQVGSGAFVDSITSTTISNTRIKGLTFSGVGTFTITGSETDEYRNARGSNIKFVGTTANDAGDVMIPDFGVRMVGSVKVSAPTSAATVTIYYG